MITFLGGSSDSGSNYFFGWSSSSGNGPFLFGKRVLRYWKLLSVAQVWTFFKSVELSKERYEIIHFL